jgi:hypothetical protein
MGHLQNTVINLRVAEKSEGIYSLAEALSAAQQSRNTPLHGVTILRFPRASCVILTGNWKPHKETAAHFEADV